GLKSIGKGWENIDHEPILKSIQWAIETYDIDQRKIYGWGYSHGGFRYGVLGAEAQDVFTAVVILGGGVRKPSDPKRSLHYYLIHGSDDKTVKVSSAHRAIETIEGAGFPYVYRELTGEGHGVSGSHKSYASRCDALKYLDRLRNPNVALNPDEQKFIDQATESVNNDKRISVKKVCSQLPFIGGKEVDVLLIVAAEKNAAAKKEDTKLTQGIATTAKYYQFDDKVAVLLGSMLQHKKKPIKAAAVQALVAAAQWNHQQALKELVSYIQNDEIKDSDRAVVVGQLGLSVPLQLTCNNVQKDLFTALIALLDHESSKLRTAAITALMGASGGNPQDAKVAAEQLSESPRGGFGYHPKLPDEKRAASIARWQKWFAGKS
ncbi:MAG: hypothetical protein HRU15_08905, partial [Planctomycetes bacterium]|nr:hypothetical protein [Planctomycetota bacterium]